MLLWLMGSKVPPMELWVPGAKVCGNESSIIGRGTMLVVLMMSVVDLGMDEGEDEPVPLPNVNAAILKKVIQWCTYHKDDPQQAEDDENKEKRTDDICTWDVEFLKVDQGTLFELILVSY